MYKFEMFMIVMLLLPCALAAETNETSAFEYITGGIFKDANAFLLNLDYALVSLFALICIVAVIVGWFTHSDRLFMSGVKGCFVIILAAIVYFIAINGFNYIADKYWK